MCVHVCVCDCVLAQDCCSMCAWWARVSECRWVSGCERVLNMFGWVHGCVSLCVSVCVCDWTLPSGWVAE